MAKDLPLSPCQERLLNDSANTLHRPVETAAQSTPPDSQTAVTEMATREVLVLRK
jgi:hypothetical protein